jgi:protein-L-isoaspartate(D-aspartate) O-methyltransferase
MSKPGAPKPARFPLVLNRMHAEAPTHPAREPLRPQRLLREAVQDAARRVSPTGIGLDSAPVRLRMVARLRAEGLGGEAVLAAMAQVQRHRFVDTALAPQAYEDTSLPIGHGQTISKPSVVARMLGLLFEGEAARASGQLGRVLEIGTGCGYQAALLAALVHEVVSIERLKALHDRAKLQLADWPLGRLQLVFGDGMLGYAARAPYQSIIAAAGGESLPQPWLDQLSPGGRLVAPMWQAGASNQVLMVVDKAADGSVRQRAHDGVLFVPLKSGTV